MPAPSDSPVLGRGWAFPPAFSLALGGAEMAAGEEDVRQSLHILLGTRVGERLMRPDYGAHLSREVFRGVTSSFTAEVRRHIRLAVTRYEPRVDIVEIAVVDEGPTTGRLLVTLTYDIRSQNTRSNLVYPFYLGEATLVGQAP